MSDPDELRAARESAAMRAQGYERVEGGEGSSWQHTGIVQPPVAKKPWFYAPKTTTPELQNLLGQTPYSVERVEEGGEGVSVARDYYDPASVAKKVLAQPEKVSAEYISRNFPSLAQLPKSVLNQMGQDWRTAYAHVQKLTEPSASGWWGGKGGAEGIVTVPFRLGPGDQPELAVGGNGEMFAEALPYITYSPEYGLGIPKAGMRPYKEKFGIMNLAPTLMLGAALGPLAGALGGGALGSAGAGAMIGGLNSAISGGDVLKGALTGGITGGIGAAATPVVGGALQSAGITGLASDVLTQAAVSAGTAALRGGDPLQAALSSAVGTGAGGVVSGLDALKDLDPAISKAVTAAASNAAKAAVTGGDPVMSALMGVADAGVNAAIGSLSPATGKPEPVAKPETPAPVEFEYGEAPIFDIIDPEKIAPTPTEKWIDQGFLVNEATPSIESLLAELGQQEEDRAAMQSSVLGYDPRITEAMQASDAEQAAMAAALSKTGAAASAKPASVAAAGAPKATAQQSAAQPTAAAQSTGMDMGALLGLLGLAQQQQPKAPPPVQLVGQIKPYEFSSDLLAGVYGKPRSNIYSANEELLNMTRGS